MRTMSIGGGTARECPAAKSPFQTVATGGSDRVCDNRGNIISTRTHDGGYGARTVNKFETVQERQNGGFEWTGSAFPLRIPTTWKVAARRAMARAHVVTSYLSVSDVVSFAVIALVVGLAWYVLGGFVG